MVDMRSFFLRHASPELHFILNTQIDHFTFQKIHRIYVEKTPFRSIGNLIVNL